VFPAWHIALTALVTAALTAAGTAGWRLREAKLVSTRVSTWSSHGAGDIVGIGVASGLGVLLWRLGANVPTLNDDPIPGVSPADVLSAPMAYVAASIYVRLRAAGVLERRERLAVAPAVAALVALIVNIVTI
jgi:hypothetical protein